MIGYTPACGACRNSERLYYIHCAGCQARRTEALKRAADTITPAQVAGMDSTMHPLERGKDA